MSGRDQTDQTITLRTGHDQLATLTQPSAAAEWDISQVFSHLGSGAKIGLATLEAALAGTGNPGHDFSQSVWARWNAMAPSAHAENFLAPQRSSCCSTGWACSSAFLGHSDELDGRWMTLTVRTVEPNHSFGLDLRDAVTLVDTPQQPAGVLDAPAEAWLRLAAGRLAPQHTPPTLAAHQRHRHSRRTATSLSWLLTRV